MSREPTGSELPELCSKLALPRSLLFIYEFFFSSRRRHTRCSRDWSSDVCSSDLETSSPAVHGHRHGGENFLGRGCIGRFDEDFQRPRIGGGKTLETDGRRAVQRFE